MKEGENPRDVKSNYRPSERNLYGSQPEMTCRIIGIQFPLEEGFPSKEVILAVSKIDCDSCDFHRVDGESSSAYFVFDSDVYAEFLGRKLLPDFEMFVQTILNDVNLESESGYYQFDEYHFWLGYGLNSAQSVNFLFRELNVDGCGGNAEACFCFPAGLSADEIEDLECLLTKTKQDYLLAGTDAGTDEIIEDALSVLKKKSGKTYQDGCITVIEF